MADEHRISPADAHAKQAAGYTYVDVRTEDEFTAGHPAGAVNVPFMLAGPGGMTPNPEFTAVMAGAFPTDAKIVLGCRSGVRSLKALTVLRAEGYTDLLDQRAGWEGPKDAFGQTTEAGWSRAGLPTETGAPAGSSYADLRARAGL